MAAAGRERIFVIHVSAKPDTVAFNAQIHFVTSVPYLKGILQAKLRGKSVVYCQECSKEEQTATIPNAGGIFFLRTSCEQSQTVNS